MSTVKQQVKDTRNRLEVLLDLATRSRKVGIMPGTVLGCNPTLFEVTDEQIQKWAAAVEAAEQA